MAASSVLEPMVNLYRLTGEQRYLDFCRYIVSSWDQPNGPKLLASLRSDRQRLQDRERQSLRDDVGPGRRRRAV